MTTSTQNPPVSIDPSRLRLDDPDGTVGTLLGMRCRECGVCMFGAAVFCQACSSVELEAVDLSRTGNLFSFTIVRVPPDGWPGPVPYVLGEVELLEGPHVLAEVVGVAHEELRVGMPVQLALEPVRSNETGPTYAVYKWAYLVEQSGAEEAGVEETGAGETGAEGVN